ncbi:lysophospholipid acyltransferase family protein [Negadavirga shengliensis]|uniref:Lysophospholipid acyltransferase family protein n=1 Tax=Negadavirga shengliensis TaxID=1389218 RepID=A0ABV9SX25_9BACT
MVVFRYIYSAYSLLMFSLLMVIFSPFILIPLFVSPRGSKTAFFFVRLWDNFWSFMVGIRYRIHGKEHIDRLQPYIYIFNHRSYLDAPVIPMAIPQDIRALGKKELAKIPVFGLLVSRLAVWVDRKDPKSREKSIGQLKNFLHKGHSIIVAPEGTRNDTGYALLPFYTGAFRLAVETQVPIIPMAVIGADKLLPKGTLLMRPGTIHIYFSSPIYPDKAENTLAVETLKEKCFNRLEAMILTHE